MGEKRKGGKSYSESVYLWRSEWISLQEVSLAEVFFIFYVILFYLFYFIYEQLHNVALAIDLMRDSGMKFQAKPEGEGSKKRLR